MFKAVYKCNIFNYTIWHNVEKINININIFLKISFYHR